MYESATLAKTSSGDLTVVLTFSLLGLALSLLIIGKAGVIDPEYMVNLFLSFQQIDYVAQSGMSDERAWPSARETAFLAARI